MEAHFVEAPHINAVVAFLRLRYPHNIDQVLPTLVQVPEWPEFWKVLDQDGHPVPKSRRNRGD